MDQEAQNQSKENASGAQETSASAASHTQTNQTTANSGTGSSGCSATAPSFDQLLTQSPTLSPLSGWLKCLRKPALSMQYSLQKRHIPDLDADTACPGQGASGKPQGHQNGQNGQSGQATASPSSAPTQTGQNSDTMGLTGGFTIRYLDLAMGALGLMMLGCLLKGCCFLKRKIF